MRKHRHLFLLKQQGPQPPIPPRRGDEFIISFLPGWEVWGTKDALPNLKKALSGLYEPPDLFDLLLDAPAFKHGRDVGQGGVVVL